MFRDDAQAARALEAVLATAGLPDLWTEAGPTPEAAALRREPTAALRCGQRLALEVAWALWERRAPPPVPLSSLPRDVDHATLAALLSLVTAYLNEPEAVDAWLAALPPPAGSVTWIEELAADWPTVDLLSLRYAHAVVERHQGDVVQAARVLDVDRRTLSRILAEARKGRVHNLHTRT